MAERAGGLLIDSCVVLDAMMPARSGHATADQLFKTLAQNDRGLHMPINSYFEYITALIVHYKRDRATFDLKDDDSVSGCKMELISLTPEYIAELHKILVGRPIPDLKSQDMIYFCIARLHGFTLITGDRKLRNMARKGELNAYEPSEALEKLLEGNL